VTSPAASATVAGSKSGASTTQQKAQAFSSINPTRRTNLQTGGAEKRLRQGTRTGSKEYAVSWCGTDLGGKPRTLGVRKVLRDRSAKLAIIPN
jgi:hypothetical protein